MKLNQPMLEQVLSLPAFLRDVFWKLESDVRLVLSTPEIFSARNLILTGCGDSWQAAICASMAFQELGRVFTQALPAMEASRYTAGVYVPEPEKNTLAIGISNSGEAARVVEAVLAFANRGCNTLALTAKPESRLGKAAAKVLCAVTPPFPGAPSPGVRTFVTALLALDLLAIRFGEVKGIITMDKAGDLRRELCGYGDMLQSAFTGSAQKLADFAALCAQHGEVEFLASGPVRGAAEFGAAKVVEAVGLCATVRDVEEFSHGSFFRRNPESIPTILLAPSEGRAASRCVETARSLKVLGRPYLIVTDNGNAFPPEHGEQIVSTGPALREAFAPLAYAALLANLAAQIDGGPESEYYRGHKGPWSEQDIVTVKDSAIQY